MMVKGRKLWVGENCSFKIIHFPLFVHYHNLVIVKVGLEKPQFCKSFYQVLSSFWTVNQNRKLLLVLCVNFPE
jgi:hypothetical protein